jgi:hypothetical protein
MFGVEAGRSPGLVVHQMTVLPRESPSSSTAAAPFVPRSKKTVISAGTGRNGRALRNVLFEYNRR